MLTNWQNILKKLSVQDTEHPAYFIHRAAVALKIEVNTLIEIGVYRGDSAKKFRVLFPKALLILVDPYKYNPANKGTLYTQLNTPEKWEALYKEQSALWDNDARAVLFRKTSLRVAKYATNGNDIIFLDGDPRYEAVKADIAAWLPRVKPGGLLCGHDYSVRGNNAGVKQAVDEMLGSAVFIGSRKTWIHYLCPG